MMVNDDLKSENVVSPIKSEQKPCFPSLTAVVFENCWSCACEMLLKTLCLWVD